MSKKKRHPIFDEPDEPNRAGPIAFWRVAERFLRELCGLFGSPAEIATSHTIRASAHRLMSRWLAAGEALLRRLLLIEAKLLAVEAPGDTHSFSSRNAPERRTEKSERPPEEQCPPEEPSYLDPAAPETWPVRFTTFPAKHSARKPRIRKAPGWRTRFASAWPLALRYEAMIRVFNDPLPYARRLARRLARDAASLPRVLRLQPDTRKLICAEDTLAVIEAAIGFAPLRVDTS